MHLFIFLEVLFLLIYLHWFICVWVYLYFLFICDLCVQYTFVIYDIHIINIYCKLHV